MSIEMIFAIQLLYYTAIIITLCACRTSPCFWKNDEAMFPEKHLINDIKTYEIVEEYIDDNDNNEDSFEKRYTLYDIEKITAKIEKEIERYEKYVVIPEIKYYELRNKEGSNFWLYIGLGFFLTSLLPSINLLFDVSYGVALIICVGMYILGLIVPEFIVKIKPPEEFFYDKKTLIEEYKQKGYPVGYIGDAYYDFSIEKFHISEAKAIDAVIMLRHYEYLKSISQTIERRFNASNYIIFGIIIMIFLGLPCLYY